MNWNPWTNRSEILKNDPEADRFSKGKTRTRADIERMTAAAVPWYAERLRRQARRKR